MVRHSIIHRHVCSLWTCYMVDRVMRKPEFEEYWIVFLVCCLVVFFMIGCTTTPTTIEEPKTEKVQTTKKQMPNPILCAILFLSADCSIKEKDNAKVYEAETHPVPVEDPILELLIDIGEVDPDESK